MTASHPAKQAARTTTTTAINALRVLAMDAVEAAQSGHPGTPMGLATAGYALWNRYLSFDSSDPDWLDRDRFVMSNGHAGLLQYALLHLTGFAVPLDELRSFRRWGSLAAGHPERGLTPGVEVTTGPLGQGVGNGVGMAIAERMLAARFNRPDLEVIDHRTWVIAGDGDLMEGVSSEAASIAGHLGLGRLIVIYDDNRITIEGSTDLAFTEDVGARFESYGWQVLSADGNGLAAIDTALGEALSDEARPSLIRLSTHIGFGSPSKQDTAEAHGAPLGAAEVAAARARLGWEHDEAFFVPEEVYEHYRGIAERARTRRRRWDKTWSRYESAHPDLAAELARVTRGQLPDGWADSLPAFEPGNKVATRKASGKVLNASAARLPELVGGSADLAPSTNTLIESATDIAPGSYSGRNFHFGVREHAMGAILNGIAAHGGWRGFGASFLIFTDYVRPSMRLAALMKLPVIYVMSHDSVGLGEDGPTHQPVEHLASLRAMPNLVVLRPADANETATAWRIALERNDGPSVIALSRQGLPVLSVPDHALARYGARVVVDGRDIVLVASGSEVSLAMAAAAQLEQHGVSARVVSMLSTELFSAAPAEVKARVLPAGTPVLAIEAGVSFGWHRYADDVVSIDRFGASAPGAVLFERFGFTPEHVCSRARKLLATAGDPHQGGTDVQAA